MSQPGNMFVSPIKRFVAKKGARNKPGFGLPVALNSGTCYTGTFNGRSVEVTDGPAIHDLSRNGAFGNTRTRKLDQSTGKVPERLLLFPEEAFFLCYSLKCFKILRRDGSTMSSEDCIREFTKLNAQFISSFIAYLYLRTKNWKLKSGVKFGGDFLMYKTGPEYFHASILVIVRTEGDTAVNPIQVQSINRVAQTSGKAILFLEVSPRPKLEDISEYLKDNFYEFFVTESIPTRFVQS